MKKILFLLLIPFVTLGQTMINVNELLIKEGHAVEYHGGKR